MFVKSINAVSGRNICLTFDDGPDPVMTPKILDILKKHNIKATFFLIGASCLKHPEIVKRIHLEGHAIGCHTFNHHYLFPFYSLKKIKQELIETNTLIKSITSKDVSLFRPPFGVTNPIMKIALDDLKMRCVGWDTRSFDTIISNPKTLHKRVVKKIQQGGSIILFHDRCKSTLGILEDTVVYCLDRDRSFITINHETKAIKDFMWKNMFD